MRASRLAGADHPLAWDDAQRRLAEQARADSDSAGHTPRQT